MQRMHAHPTTTARTQRSIRKLATSKPDWRAMTRQARTASPSFSLPPVPAPLIAHARPRSPNRQVWWGSRHAQGRPQASRHKGGLRCCYVAFHPHDHAHPCGLPGSWRSESQPKKSKKLTTRYFSAVSSLYSLSCHHSPTAKMPGTGVNTGNGTAGADGR